MSSQRYDVTNDMVLECIVRHQKGEVISQMAREIKMSDSALRHRMYSNGYNITDKDFTKILVGKEVMHYEAVRYNDFLYKKRL